LMIVDHQGAETQAGFARNDTGTRKHRRSAREVRRAALDPSPDVPTRRLGSS
jgi:hypothetical protein